MSRVVVVMLGTDHHRFDRLVDWADELAARHPDARVVVQHGASRAPVVAAGQAYLSHDQIVSLLAEAAAVVCHAGPGTIMDARAAGHVPLCVPRDPTLGEHVDGHQQRFAALVAQAGVVHRADSVDRLDDLVAGLLAAANGSRKPVPPTSPATEAARVQLGRELDELMVTRSSGSRWGRRARVPDRPRDA